MTIKTHYDTLKVTQDAPVEVIAAAYKALANIYHPDKNTSNPDAMLIMQNLNISYKILSDPQKRAEHDLWIRSQERRSTPTAPRDKTSSSDDRELQAKADKAAAEAKKWTAWAAKAAQDAKEAQARADKAVVDLTKAKPEDRAKWETWVARTAQEAKEAKEKSDKAAAQSAEAVTNALDLATQLQIHKTTGNK